MNHSLKNDVINRRGRLAKLSRRSAFTLVEMLVAMALAMLMMAALARSFSFVSTQVRDSRAETELSGELRDVSTRLADEFDQRTCSLRPAGGDYEPNGYVFYHEGGVTDATSSLFRSLAIGDQITSADGRYGDFDDYLAFTATAPGESWFTGKVPRYLLEQKTAANANGTYTLPTFGSDPDGHRRAFEPVVITSKYAEIIYYCTPEYEPASLPANPVFIDTEADDPNITGDENPDSSLTIGNGFPDRLRLHRRVLLIRPDLNINGVLPVQTQGNGSDSVQFMRADSWPTAAASEITGGAVANQAWAYGMAGVHQQCDLSIRRVRNGDGTITNRVAANTLAELSIPHNRFGNVNVPAAVLGGGNARMSMPVLALQNSLGLFEATTLSGSTDLAPPRTPSVGPVVTPSIVSGFIRPEFVLGLDGSHRDIAGDGWGSERLGEDVVLSGVLGFDLQVFDPDVRIVDTSTFAAADRTNVIVGPSQAGYREALAGAISQITGGQTLDRFTERGGYVDLCYPVLAGGSLRGWRANRSDRRSTADANAIGTIGSSLITPFSGIANFAAGVNSLDAYTSSLSRAGKLVTAGNTIVLFQPAFDTFTNYYESDGLRQAPINNASVGTRTVFPPATTPIDRGGDGLDSDGLFGVDDAAERETSPPFVVQPDSLRVSIRLENSAVRSVRQQSVVLRD